MGGDGAIERQLAWRPELWKWCGGCRERPWQDEKIKTWEKIAGHGKIPQEPADWGGQRAHNEAMAVVFFPSLVKINVLLSAAKRAHIPPRLRSVICSYMTFVSCCVDVWKLSGEWKTEGAEPSGIYSSGNVHQVLASSGICYCSYCVNGFNEMLLSFPPGGLVSSWNYTKTFSAQNWEQTTVCGTRSPVGDLQIFTGQTHRFTSV